MRLYVCRRATFDVACVPASYILTGHLCMSPATLRIDIGRKKADISKVENKTLMTNSCIVMCSKS